MKKYTLDEIHEAVYEYSNTLANKESLKYLLKQACKKLKGEIEVTTDSKFKVGDEVVIVANNNKHGFKIGQKVVIEQIWGRGGYSAREIGGDWWGVDESEIVAEE